MLHPVPQSRLTPVANNSVATNPAVVPNHGAPATDTEWSNSLHTMLDQYPSTLSTRLTIGGLAFCACFASWAWFGRVNEVAHAQGKLVPRGEVYKVNPVESGRVDRVLVQEGQTVKAGQVVAELNSDIATNDVERLEQELESAQTEFRQMQFLLEQNRAQAKLQQLIAESQIQAQRVAIKQAQENAKTAKALTEQFQADVVAQTERIARLKPLAKLGAISQEQMFAAQESSRERRRSLTENKGILNRNLADVERLHVELAQKQAEVQKIELESQQQIEQMGIQITQQNAKVGILKTQLKTARAKLQDRFLYAPVNGVVSSLGVRNPGEVLQPGQPLAEIAPAGQPLTLSATLPNQEAGSVKPGMTVQLKFDAFPFQDYGIVPGKVRKISPDTHADEKQGQVYRVEIQVDRSKLPHGNKEVSLKAGQTATAEIVTRNRRILDVMLDPLKQLQSGMNL